MAARKTYPIEGDQYLEAFEHDCRILHQILHDTNNSSLLGLEWCGLRLADVVSTPRLFYDQMPKAPKSENAHGFRPLFVVEGFKGAYSGRAAKWRLPRLQGAPFPRTNPPVADLLEQRFCQLRQEYALLKPALDRHPDSDEVLERGAWRAIILDGPAGMHPTLADNRFPSLTYFLEHSDYCQPFGFCMFLRMDAPTSLRPHVGSTNLRLRCHLGVEVDTREPRATVVVNGQRRAWKEGQCLVFDDSFVHSARHEQGSPRIVFNLDIWHPDLTAEERAALSDPVFKRFGKVR